MKSTTLPGTDLAVSALAFGCWGITSDFHWGARDETQSIAAIHAAVDSGINFFDTAAAYGDGNSELVLGKALAHKRNRVVIATKVKADSMLPDQIPISCERSLKRLGTDYIDLYQTHWFDPKVPVAESWGAMLRLKEQGKVRAVATCNMGLGHLADLKASPMPVCNQLPYNLLWRCIEQEILPGCRAAQIAVLVYSPLMHGLLAGKYRTAAEVPDGRARSRHFHTKRILARHGEAGCEGETFAALRAIEEICRGMGRSMADVALAWVAAQPGITSVISGVCNPQQLAQNVATINDPLPAEAIERLSMATEPLNRALGPNPDMWQGANDSRYW